MHDEDFYRREFAAERMRRSILTEVLFVHPEQLTVQELFRRVEGEPRGTGQDTVDRAMHELNCDGLIACHGCKVSPTRAAISFDELLRCG